MKHFTFILCCTLFVWGCSTKNNTPTTRLYHEINTRYNVYFNANEAYKENVKSQLESRNENLSKLLEVYPIDKDISENKEPGGSFDPTVDKTTKAIKLHSIKAKPKRDPSKRKNTEYQLWLKQQEFNPFLKNAWLLLGKGEYQNKDYLLASSTFSYIIRLYKTDPEVVTEARLWLAKCYLAMNWTYEAENIFYNLGLEGSVSKDYESLYAEIYADLLVRKKEYNEAIPYLEKAIKGLSGIEAIRLKYLLGQAYAIVGKKEEAYKAFQSVQGLNTPYKYTFNAKIQQAAFVDNANRKEVLSELNKMTQNSKNKEYLDQVYYAIGNVYLAEKDTTQAIDSYKKALEKSTRDGYDKSVTGVLLGDIYFKQNKYIEAQPVYSDALTNLDKREDNYQRVEQRSAILDELVVYLKAIHLQDSLQELSRMPESERLIAINKVILEVKKKQDEEKRKERENQTSNNDQPQNQNTGGLFDLAVPNMPKAPIIGTTNNSSFYFYNPQLVEQGKTAFQRKWGNRKQEDNWRRQNKQVSLFNEPQNENNIVDSGDSEKSDNREDVAAEDNPLSVDYYLRQIPFSKEAIEKSNKIIEDAYYNSGLIYKDKLEDYKLAIKAFDTDLKRFPSTPNKEEIYYQLFLIYLKLGDKNMAEKYRKLILSDFSGGDYATTLRSDNYEWNLRNIYKLQDDLYQQTYDAYLAGNISQVRTNYKSIQEKYPLSDLIPKFMYLNALTYAQSKQPIQLKEELAQLVEKYPKSDVTPVASEMLKGLLSGKILSSDTSVARGMIWDMQFSSNPDAEAAGVDFVAKADTEYLLLFIYPSQIVDKNQLIYDIANYNFSKFVYKTFDLDFNNINGIDFLQVRGFDSLKDISEYVDLAFEKGSLMNDLDKSIVTVPITADNYIALMNGKTLNEYFVFFEKNYTKQMPKIVNLWKKQQNMTDKEDLKEEDKNDSITAKIESEKTEDMPSIESEEDNRIYTSTPDKVEDTGKKDTEIKIEVEDILPETVIEKADDIINKGIDVIANPLDGLKNILNSSNDESKMAKKEKERKKQEERAQKEEEKERKKQEAELLKMIEKEQEEREKAYSDSIKNIEQQKELETKELLRSKEQEQKNIKQQKEEELKQKAQAQKELEEERKKELKAREEERKKLLNQKDEERKLKEQERKNEAKLREEERRQKQREKLETLKQREAEGKAYLKQREQERKNQAKLREEERKQKQKETIDAIKRRAAERKEFLKQKEQERKLSERERKKK